MTWLWIYITLMEWVGIVFVLYALRRDECCFDVKKIAIYLLASIIFYVIYWYYQIPDTYSFLSYFILFGYIYWTYRENFIRCFSMLVISLMTIGVIEMLIMQILHWLIPFDLKLGILEAVASTLLAVICVILSRFKFYKILCVLDKWEPSYALVAALSFMIFTPVVLFRILRKLDVTEYIYIAICIFVMWMLVYKIQKYNMESRIRKKYLESFTDVIAQIRRRQHRVKNQFNTAFGLYRLYDTYDELVEKQKEYLDRLWDYELPTDAITLEDPVVVALLYEKINEAIEHGIEVETVFSCSMLNRKISDVMWIDILGTLLDNAIEALENYNESRKLWIAIEEDKQESERIVIRIANSFRKLKQSEMEKFFELGFSTKGENRGIGLYDVKELIYKSKGMMLAESVVRDGIDCFQITITV